MDFSLLRLTVIWFCGSFIGSVLALHLGYFWWVGCLLGGMAGALMECYKRIIPAIKSAYKAVRGWRPDKERWVMGLKTFVYMFSALVNASAFLVILMAIPVAEGTSLKAVNFVSFACSTTVMCIVAAGFAAIFLSKYGDGDIALMKWVASRVNVIVAPFLFLRFILMDLIPRLLRLIGSILEGIPKFLFAFFRILNSKELVACAVFCTVCSAIGYYLKSPILGGVAGALIGVLEFRLLAPFLGLRK